jgi:hypothetical protein
MSLLKVDTIYDAAGTGPVSLGGGSVIPVTAKTGNYTATVSDEVILCSGASFTITLPAANSKTGKRLVVKKTDSSTSNIITVSRAGSDTIDGATSVTLLNRYEFVILVSDGGTVWSVLEFKKSPTEQTFTSGSGTYNPSAGVKRIDVLLVGAGGGGGGNAGTANSGGATTFGTITANGGGGGNASATAGAGGTASLGSGPVGMAVTGNYGIEGSNSTNGSGGNGGAGPWGGSGKAGNSVSPSGTDGVANTGSGGGGRAGAGGGGAGGYVSATIYSPSSVSYSVGAGATAVAGGTNGGSGVIRVREFY